jgi:DNA invertase Pin-like site-specific DNA recombinase
MTVGVMAVAAQHEREAISQRTKASLAAAKARGTILGGKRKGAAKIRRKGIAAAREKAREAAELRREAIETLARDGLSLNAMAARLNADSVTTSRRGHPHRPNQRTGRSPAHGAPSDNDGDTVWRVTYTGK